MRRVDYRSAGFQDMRSIFEIGKKRVLAGRSIEQIEADWLTGLQVPSYQVKRARRLVVAYANARKLDKMDYLGWILERAEASIFSVAGLGLALLVAPSCFFVCFWIVRTLGLGNGAVAILPLFLLLFLPIVFLVGWPIFLASRAYWRWRIGFLIWRENFDVIHANRLSASDFSDEVRER